MRNIHAKVLSDFIIWHRLISRTARRLNRVLFCLRDWPFLANQVFTSENTYRRGKYHWTTGFDSEVSVHTNNNISSCFVKYNPVKLATSCSVILPPLRWVFSAYTYLYVLSCLGTTRGWLFQYCRQQIDHLYYVWDTKIGRCDKSRRRDSKLLCILNTQVIMNCI